MSQPDPLQNPDLNSVHVNPAETNTAQTRHPDESQELNSPSEPPESEGVSAATGTSMTETYSEEDEQLQVVHPKDGH